MITNDGREIQKGDKVWFRNQDGWAEVIVGEPFPWSPNFIVKPRYCWVSKEAGMGLDGIKAILDGGKELEFHTLDHKEVHESLRQMGLKDEEYTIHFFRKKETKVLI